VLSLYVFFSFVSFLRAPKIPLHVQKLASTVHYLSEPVFAPYHSPSSWLITPETSRTIISMTAWYVIRPLQQFLPPPPPIPFTLSTRIAIASYSESISFPSSLQPLLLHRQLCLISSLPPSLPPFLSPSLPSSLHSFTRSPRPPRLRQQRRILTISKRTAGAG